MPAGKRRRLLQSSGPQPMYVIAGLPKSVHHQAVDALQQRLPHAIVKGIPSLAGDHALYPQPHIVSLVRSVGEFVIRRRGNGNAQPAPASITLFFVPSPDQEALLRTFDFAVMAVPLAPLIVRDVRGRQARHDIAVISETLIAATRAASDARMNLNEVERRLAYQSDNESLLLPPRNFVTQDGDLVGVFRDFRNAARPWNDRLVEFGPEALGHDDVPKRVAAQQTRHPFVDARGMAFFIAHPKAYDGPGREVEDNENIRPIVDAMRKLYRFGGALPPGLHHDAQRSDGSPLDGAFFQCSEKGRIRGMSDYANVYPNDYVRVAKYEPEE